MFCLKYVKCRSLWFSKWLCAIPLLKKGPAFPAKQDEPKAGTAEICGTPALVSWGRVTLAVLLTTIASSRKHLASPVRHPAAWVPCPAPALARVLCSVQITALFSRAEVVRGELPLLCADSRTRLCLSGPQRLGWPQLASRSSRVGT